MNSVLIILCATLCAYATGICFVWTSPYIPKFTSSDETVNPIGRVITTLEEALIVSSTAIGLIFGPPLSIMCSTYFTKKIVLLVVTSPIVAAHIICTFATQVNHFIVARLLMGIASGAIWTILGAYIAEISEDRNRGFFGCLSNVMANLGSLFGYVVGPYVNMAVFSFINLIPLLLFYVLFPFLVPDSPYDLVIKKKEQEAEKCLIKLRKHSNVQKELAFIVETIEFDSKEDFKIVDLIRRKSLFRALIICMGLMLFLELSGILAVFSYTQTIFDLAGSSLSSTISSMIIGLVSTISSIAGCYLTDRIGRRVLLIASCGSACISLFFLGIYFFLLNNGINISILSWLPITSLIVYVVAINLGLGILPFVIIGEVFPPRVKTLASTIVTLFGFTLAIIVTICFPYMVKFIGMAGTFWLFSGVMLLGCIFCFVFVLETKDKNFQEIEDMLMK